MRYSIAPRDHFLKIMVRMQLYAKNISNKCSQKLLDGVEKSISDAIKNASKRAIQKTAEATSDLSGNKIGDEIASISKSPQNASKEFNSQTSENEIEIPKEIPIFPEKRQQIIDELRLF